jgi:UDP-N-acetyl-D-galactosamine dehydrogenase
VKELADFGCRVDVHDPWATSEDVKHEYGFELVGAEELEKGAYDAVILAVAHERFRSLDVARLRNENGVVYDVKSFLDPMVVDGRL